MEGRRLFTSREAQCNTRSASGSLCGHFPLAHGGAVTRVDFGHRVRPPRKREHAGSMRHRRFAVVIGTVSHVRANERTASKTGDS